MMWPFVSSVRPGVHAAARLRVSTIITAGNNIHRRHASALETGHIEVKENEGILYINSEACQKATLCKAD